MTTTYEFELTDRGVVSKNACRCAVLDWDGTWWSEMFRSNWRSIVDIRERSLPTNVMLVGTLLRRKAETGEVDTIYMIYEDRSEQPSIPVTPAGEVLPTLAKAVDCYQQTIEPLTEDFWGNPVMPQPARPSYDPLPGATDYDVIATTDCRRVAVIYDALWWSWMPRSMRRTVIEVYHAGAASDRLVLVDLVPLYDAAYETVITRYVAIYEDRSEQPVVPVTPVGQRLPTVSYSIDCYHQHVDDTMMHDFWAKW